MSSPAAIVFVRKGAGAHGVYQRYDGAPEVVVPLLRSVLARGASAPQALATACLALLKKQGWSDEECSALPSAEVQQEDVLYTYEVDGDNALLTLRSFDGELLYRGALDAYFKEDLGDWEVVREIESERAALHPAGLWAATAVPNAREVILHELQPRPRPRPIRLGGADDCRLDTRLRFDPTGAVLAAVLQERASWSEHVCLVDPRSGAVGPPLRAPFHTRLFCVDLSAGGAIVVAGADYGYLLAWDGRTGTLLNQYRADPEATEIHACAVDPTGRRAAAADNIVGNPCVVWELKNDARLVELPSPGYSPSLHFLSPDHLLVSGSAPKAKLVDVSGGAIDATLARADHLVRAGEILVTAANRRRLASVTVHRFSPLRRLCSFKLHGHQVEAVAVDPEKRSLLCCARRLEPTQPACVRIIRRLFPE